MFCITCIFNFFYIFIYIFIYILYYILYLYIIYLYFKYIYIYFLQEVLVISDSINPPIVAKILIIGSLPRIQRTCPRGWNLRCPVLRRRRAVCIARTYPPPGALAQSRHNWKASSAPPDAIFRKWDIAWRARPSSIRCQTS